MTTPHLNIGYIAQNQSQKEVTANEAFSRLDALLNTGVIDRDLASPPSNPSAGDVYIPASSSTGDWLGKDDYIAYFDNNIWNFISPNKGLTLWLNDEDKLITYDGTGWVDSSGVLQNISMLGVNTAADTVNRLAVSSEAVLFTHSGSNSQVKVNKKNVTDSASHLFQTNWSGRAEFGLTGDDDFHVKVSPDGTNWHDSFVVDKDTGDIDFKKNITSNGEAIVSNSNRNYIINGGLDIWQRSTAVTSSTAGGYIAADRFFFDFGGATCDVLRQSFPAGQTEVPDNPSFYLRYRIVGTAAGNAILIHRIEDVASLSGEEVTLSFWARSSSPTTVTTDFQQYFGVAGSPLVDGNSQAVQHSIGTTWQKFTSTFNIYSISGKTVGAGSYLQVRLFFPNSAAMDVDFARFKMEKGRQATKFVATPLQQELALCQRYYYQSNQGNSGGGVIGSIGVIACAGGLAISPVIYPVSMRAAPTVTLVNNGVVNQVRNTNSGATVAVSTPVFIGALNTGFAGLQDAGGSPFTVGIGYDFDIRADAEL